MAGPRSLFPLRYLDKAVGFLLPRSQASFPVLCPRPSFRFFVPPFFVPCHRFITPSPPSEKEASHTLDIIYTLIFNTFVRGMPVQKTRNRLNLTSTERGSTKNPRKIVYHAQGTVHGLPGTGLLPVLHAFVFL